MAYNPDNQLGLLRPERLLHDDPTIWGNPFHGLVTNGELELPSTATKTYPQPADGSTQALGSPPVPLVRTPAQQAQDTINEFTWRETNIVAGRLYQLGGFDLLTNPAEPHGVYFDGNNIPWLIRITATGSSLPSMRFNVFVEQAFGRFKINTLAADPPFDVQILTNHDFLLSDLAPVVGSTPFTNDQANGGILQQNKTGSSMLINLPYNGFIGVAAVLRFNFSGNGDLADGTGISVTPVIERTPTQCYEWISETGDTVDDLLVVRADVDGNVRTGSNVTTNPPLVCVVPGDTGNLTTLTRTCFAEADRYFIANGLVSTTGPATWPEAMTGSYERVTYRNGRKMITHAYFDHNDNVVTLGINETHVFLDSVTYEINGVSPVVGPGLPIAAGNIYETSRIDGQSDESRQCVCCPPNTISLGSELSEETSDWVHDIDFRQTTTLTSSFEMTVDGAISETVVVEAKRQNDIDNVLNSVGVDTDIPGALPPGGTLSCNDTNLGLAGETNLASEVGYTTSTLDIVRTFTLEIDGVEVFNHVQNENISTGFDKFTYLTDQPNGQVMAQVANTIYSLVNPVDWFWIDRWTVEPWTTSNKTIGIKVDVDVDVEGEASFAADTYYYVVSGADKLTGEVEEFSTVNPDDGAVTNDVGAVCFV